MNFNFYSLLKLSFFTDEESRGKWSFVLFVVFLLLVVISSSHSIDNKVILIDRLSKEKRLIRAEFLDLKVVLAKMKLESSVSLRVKEYGLGVPKNPPKKISVTK